MSREKSEKHEEDLKAKIAAQSPPATPASAPPATPAATPATEAKADATVATTTTAPEVSPRHIDSTASPSAATPEDGATAMTLKRDCKVHDGPSRDSKVLGVRLGGQSISQASGDKSWVAFPMEDGKKGFVATSCF